MFSQACLKNSVLKRRGVRPSMQWVGVVSASGSKECTPPWADTPEMATAADGTHPIGIHSCYLSRPRVPFQSVTLSKLSLNTTLERNKSIGGLVLPPDPHAVCYLGKHFAVSFSPLIHPLNSYQTYQHKLKLRIIYPSPPVVRRLFRIRVFLVFTAGNFRSTFSSMWGGINPEFEMLWFIRVERQVIKITFCKEIAWVQTGFPIKIKENYSWVWVWVGMFCYSWGEVI